MCYLFKHKVFRWAVRAQTPQTTLSEGLPPTAADNILPPALAPVPAPEPVPVVEPVVEPVVQVVQSALNPLQSARGEPGYIETLDVVGRAKKLVVSGKTSVFRMATENKSCLTISNIWL